MISKACILAVLTSGLSSLSNLAAQSDEVNSAYIVQLLYLNEQHLSSANADMGVSLKYLAEKDFTR